jgi:hypothetical protein
MEVLITEESAQNPGVDGIARVVGVQDRISATVRI